MSVEAQRRALRLAFVAALLVELFALHFPAPSGVSNPADQHSVRHVWRSARDVGHDVGQYVPSSLGQWLDPILDDKSIHFLLFLPLGLLVAAERSLTGRLDARRMLGIVGVLSLYAAVSEATQYVTGRSPEIGDWVANLIGAAIGVGMVGAYHRLKA